MRKAMPQNMENVIRNSNSNDEIRKLCSKNSDLEIELKKSLDQPKRPIEDVFKELSQKGKKIEIFQSVTQDKIDTCNNILLNNFDENILTLSLRADFTKSTYPKLHEFYTKHCVSRNYYFHVFKCSELDCPWHEPLRYGDIPSFGVPVPKEKTDGSITYIQGSSPSEKFLPSKLENSAKHNHGMPFAPTAQTALNVGITVKCSECC